MWHTPCIQPLLKRLLLGGSLDAQSKGSEVKNTFLCYRSQKNEVQYGISYWMSNRSPCLNWSGNSVEKKGLVVGQSRCLQVKDLFFKMWESTNKATLYDMGKGVIFMFPAMHHQEEKPRVMLGQAATK